MLFLSCCFFVCFAFSLLLCASFCLSFMKITVFSAILVFWGFNVHSISVSHFNVWFFAFCFCCVCLLFQNVPLIVLICLLSCFVLSHNLRFTFALHLLCLLLFLFLCLYYYYYFYSQLPIKKPDSKKVQIPKTPKMKMH